MKYIEKITTEFVIQSRQILKDNLVGIYLHGSASMGCFNLDKSDIDMIVVVDEEMTITQKQKFMEMVYHLDSKMQNKGIEMSIVRASNIVSFIYPTPYDLHYSRTH